MSEHDDGTALALFIELGAYFDPKLKEHDKAIVLDKIRYRTEHLIRALNEIAGSHTERVGYDQTDIDEVPDLTADEAVKVARKALTPYFVNPTTKTEG